MKIGRFFVLSLLAFIHWITQSNGEDNVEVFCSEDFIRIIATFDEPFYGRLTTGGAERDCAVYGAGHRNLRMDVATDPAGRRRCNVTKSDIDYVIQLEIQTNAALLTADDTTYVVRCPRQSLIRATTTLTTSTSQQLPFDEETIAETGDWPFNESPGTFGPTDELDLLDEKAPESRPTTYKVYTKTRVDTKTTTSTPAASRRIPQQSENEFTTTRRPPIEPAITSEADRHLSMAVNQSELNILRIVQPIRGALPHNIVVNTRIGRCVAYNGTFVLQGQTYDFVQLTDDNGCPLAAELDPPLHGGGSRIDAPRAFAVESRSANFFAHCTVHTCRGACETPECAPGASAPIFVVDGGAEAAVSIVPTVSMDPVAYPNQSVERRGAQFMRQFENAARDGDDDFVGRQDREWNFLTVGIVLCFISFMVVLLLIQYICVPKCDDSHSLIRSSRLKKMSTSLLSENLAKHCTRDEHEGGRNGAVAPNISLDGLPPPPSIPLCRLLQFARRSSDIGPIQSI